MPANLPPAYKEAEAEYRQARAVADKLEALRHMLAVMPKHKGTDHLRADLRSRMAKLNAQAETQTRRGGGRGDLYAVRKEGAGQVALVGLPNAGKSHLLAALTDAHPRVAEYPYTTWEPQPAMMLHENVQVQLVDLPTLEMHQSHGWIRALVRQADLLLIVLDLTADPLAGLETLLLELEGIGLDAVAQCPEAADGDDEEVVSIPKPTVVVGTKRDLAGAAEAFADLTALYGSQLPLLSVSATTGTGLDELRQRLFAALEVVRVYTRSRDQPADRDRPMIVPRGATLEDLAASIHKQWRGKVKYAQVWGTGKFDGQRVSRTYVIQDGDTIELRL